MSNLSSTKGKSMSAPWTDQPTPLVDAVCPWKRWQIEIEAGEEYAALADQSRTLEQRMRAAEALLMKIGDGIYGVTRNATLVEIDAHLAAAQAMDAGEFPYVAEDLKNSREFAKVVNTEDQHHE